VRGPFLGLTAEVFDEPIAATGPRSFRSLSIAPRSAAPSTTAAPVAVGRPAGVPPVLVLVIGAILRSALGQISFLKYVAFFREFSPSVNQRARAVRIAILIVEETVGHDGEDPLTEHATRGISWDHAGQWGGSPLGRR
jgi:hypothetical protein